MELVFLGSKLIFFLCCFLCWLLAGTAIVIVESYNSDLSSVQGHAA